MKKIIIYILFFLIIFASFKVPEILFKIRNDLAETEVHKIKEEKSKIDIETQKIYLVKAIHDMEQEKMSYSIMSDDAQSRYGITESIVDNEGAKNELCKEIINLQNCEIIANLNIDSAALIKRDNLDRKYTNKENKYTINCYYLEIDNNYFGYEIESKTEKIIYIMFRKQFLPNTAKQEILMNYIKYLELSIIDDWKYENEMLVSEKAGLVASLIENDSTYNLSINTEEKIKRMYNNKGVISVSDSIQKWYKNDTNLLQHIYINMLKFAQKWKL